MNKILIALVLAVVMSGNAYAKDKLYFICNDEESNKIETWEIYRGKESAYRYFIYATGEIAETEYKLKMHDYYIIFTKLEYRNHKSTEKEYFNYYELNRQTLELKVFGAGYINNDFRVDPKFCKISKKVETREFRKKISTTRKLKYEKTIKF